MINIKIKKIKALKYRYKICFQTQNKVWIYKNSRLRNFYKIRGKVVLLQGKTARKFLITKNMKWTVIRRKMVPYVRTKNRFRFNYKNLFYTKQQLKNFYGGLREYKLRNIFKKTWNVELFYRRNIFIGALEQRLNMVLFRMRLLPTIFASTQYILHKGIFINNKLISLPSYRVGLGAIVSIPQEQWFVFYKFLYQRLCNRFFGECLLIWRKDFTLKKIQYYRLRKKKFLIKNLKFFKQYTLLKNKSKKLKKILKKLQKQYLNKLDNLKIQKNNLNLKIFWQRKFFYKKIYNVILYLRFYLNKISFKTLKKIKKNLKKLRRWGSKFYLKNIRFFFYRFYFFKFWIKKFKHFLIFFIQKNIYQNNLFLLKKKPNKINIQTKLNLLQLQESYTNLLSNFKKEISLQRYWYINYKKTLYIRPKIIRYKKRLYYLIKRLKYRKRKKKMFKKWCAKPHWYIPKYLEIDYQTLRCVFVYYPEAHEVFYGFPCSFNKIIAFYKERSL